VTYQGVINQTRLNQYQFNWSSVESVEELAPADDGHADVPGGL
jgi:hypothetical protein